jgi:hypothetical protein
VLRGATIRSQCLRVERFIAGLLSVKDLDASRERAWAEASSPVFSPFERDIAQRKRCAVGALSRAHLVEGSNGSV